MLIQERMKHTVISASGFSLTKRERYLLLRRHALHLKYEEAVTLYTDTDMPLKAIAGKCGVPVGGLGSYLRRYWRELVLRRHEVPVGGRCPQDVKIIEAGKQSEVAHAKYKDAVEACDSQEYIEFNIAQIARKFGVEGTSLAAFMRMHYADILGRREKVRRWLGIADNIRRGMRPECAEQYAGAVELYAGTDMTVEEVAGLCGVSPDAFSQHLRFYHKGVLERKRRERRQARGRSRDASGGLTGNGRRYGPSDGTERKYAGALLLYRDTALTMKEIAVRTGVTEGGLRCYLHKWHRNLVLERAGVSGEGNGRVDLRKERKRMKATAAKYAGAVGSLRRCPRPLSEVAAEFGFSPEALRNYLRRQEPELARQQGMMWADNGRRVSRRSEMKYAEAVRLYGSTAESLKSIAVRLGLPYGNVGGYVRRNCPEVIARHRALLRDSAGN